MADEATRVTELREAWARSGAPAPHPADAARLQQDSWLRKFLVQSENDVPQALTMLTESLAWRKSFGTNDIDEASLNQDHLRAGLFYPRGRDRDDCTLMVFKSKKHVRGLRDFDEVMRCLVYWFERLDKHEHCERISVFFDMADTGLSHMDMEFTKYIIGLFKYYYPDFLNYIFIYELPWVLTAAFKLIKTMLPAKAVEKLKFINKGTIKDFIPEEHIHTAWGGKDDYVYSFIPLSGSTNQPEVPSKKVTFADPGTPVQDGPKGDFEFEDRNETLMKISPRDVIIFKRVNDETSGYFTVMNVSSGNIAYKVKTTAPERIKISPSMGVLAAGDTASVKILLCSGHPSSNSSVASIKFLIVCTSIERNTMSQQELTEMWKNMSSLKQQQHRLRCSISDFTVSEGAAFQNIDDDVSVGDVKQSSDSQKQLSMLTKSIADMKIANDNLVSQIKTLKTLQLISVTLSALFLYLIVYFFRNVQFTERCGDFYNGP